MAKEAKCPAFDWVGGCAPFVGGRREDVKAAQVWERKLYGFDDGCWLVGRSMLLFIGSRGCNIREWG